MFIAQQQGGRRQYLARAFFDSRPWCYQRLAGSVAEAQVFNRGTDFKYIARELPDTMQAILRLLGPWEVRPVGDARGPGEAVAVVDLEGSDA